MAKVANSLAIAVAAASFIASNGLAQAADPATGAQQFKQRCMACHSVTAGAKGVAAPNLAGVANRAAASTPYAYSAALKKSGLKWTAPTLSTFLTGPAKMVPGTRMFASVPDQAARDNIVAYLMTLKK